MTASPRDRDFARLFIALSASLCLHFLVALIAETGPVPVQQPAQSVRVQSIRASLAPRHAHDQDLPPPPTRSAMPPIQPPAVNTAPAPPQDRPEVVRTAQSTERARMLKPPSRQALETLEVLEDTQVVIVLQVSEIGTVETVTIEPDRTMPEATINQIYQIFSTLEFFPARRDEKPVKSTVRLRIEIAPLPQIRFGVPSKAIDARDQRQPVSTGEDPAQHAPVWLPADAGGRPLKQVPTGAEK